MSLKKEIKKDDVISKFMEKCGRRLQIRSKVNEMVWSYLSDVKCFPPLSVKMALQRKIKNVLG
jgi:hypothetical protein